MSADAQAPPQHVEAEQATLGALLVSASAHKSVFDEVGLVESDMQFDKNRVLFAAMLDLYRAGKPVDELSVIDALTVAGDLKRAGDRHYVGELAAKVPAVGNAKHYAEIVKREALETKRIDLARKLADPNLNGEAPVLADELAALIRSRGQGDSDGIKAIAFSSVEREVVKWLWEGRIPLGMLTLLMGDPGLGKSLLTTMLAALVSRAGGDVLLLSAEDHKGATIRPRLEAADADLARVHHVEVRRDGVEDGLLLPDDGAELDRLVKETGSRLVVVDPLMAHLPESVNSWSDQSVRRALAPLYRLSAERRCAAVVVAHLNKAKGGNALHRTGGSIGIPAAVRSALLLARDPEDPDPERGSRRVLAHVKCNVAAQAESLSCDIDTVVLEDYSEAPKFSIVGTSATTAADLLDADETCTERDEATEFLLAELADGALPAKEIDKARKDAGISERTLRRAREDLGIKPQKNGLNGAWTWELPQDVHPLTAVQDGHAEQDDQPYIPNVAIFDCKAINKGSDTHTESQDGHQKEMGTLEQSGVEA